MWTVVRLAIALNPFVLHVLPFFSDFNCKIQMSDLLHLAGAVQLMRMHESCELQQ